MPDITLDLGAEDLNNVSIILDEDQERTKQQLVELFPSVDPKFLENEALWIGSDEVKLQAFIDTNLGKSGLPSRKEFELNLAKEDRKKKILQWKAKDFIREYDEDPISYFNNIEKPLSEPYKESCKKYVQHKFSNLSLDVIKRALEKNNYHLLATNKNLLQSAKSKRSKNVPPRSPEDIKGYNWDLDFIKEYLFMKWENEIEKIQQFQKSNKERKISKAKRRGQLFTCLCCFDEECLYEDLCMCPGDHMFCRTCVRRGSEVQIGDNQIQISCFQQDCDRNFEMEALEKVLKPRVYQKLLARKQADDISKAGIKNLVTCPSCHYAVEMPESEKVFNCENPDCRKSACRLCWGDNHLPLRCEEVEKDDEVKRRTQIENAMSEAMIRTCPKCDNRFFKTEGCNLMKCKCGTTMCYLCRKAVPNNYKHFYGQGSSPKTGQSL